FSTAGVVLAEAFVAMPFLVISVEGALRAADLRYEEAAATLGASRWTGFRRGTPPLGPPGVAGGAGPCRGRAPGGFVGPSTLRRELPRPDADDAARRLPGPRDRPRGGRRPQPGPPGRLHCGAGQSPRTMDLVSTLDARLRVSRPAFDLDLELTVEQGEVVALL